MVTNQIYKFIDSALYQEKIGTVCFDDPLEEISKIEPRIRPLIKALNASGEYKTLACCQGHIDCLPWPHISAVHCPYVMFKSDQKNYKMIWNLLAPHSEQRIRSYLNWHPELSVYPDYPHDVVMTLRGSPRYLWTSREEIDSDFVLLEQLMIKVAKDTVNNIRSKVIRHSNNNDDHE
jgi:hypothetical protein